MAMMAAVDNAELAPLGKSVVLNSSAPLEAVEEAVAEVQGEAVAWVVWETS